MSMKLAYIGSFDELADVFIERMSQEGHDVYFVSDEKPARKSKRSFKYRFFKIPRKDEELECLLDSITADCIVFAGSHFFAREAEETVDRDMTYLAQSLRVAVSKRQTRFILLSSADVEKFTLDQGVKHAPAPERVLRFVREESLVRIYSDNYGLNATIIRASDLFAFRARQGGGDVLSSVFDLAYSDSANVGPVDNHYYQLLHVSDLVDALNRVINRGTQDGYTVAGKKPISTRDLYQLACKVEQRPERAINWNSAGEVTVVDSEAVRQELAWNEIHGLENEINNGNIVYERRSETKRRKTDGGIIPKPIRQFIENLAIFCVFFAVSYFTTSNGLFPQVDWLMIYVVLIAIAYSMYQSAFAALLASGAYFFVHQIGFVQYSSFYAYADNLLIITQYLFMGLIISYTCSTLRENARNSREEYEILKEDFDDLKVINAENVLIKNEYEKRLLSANNGLPKLYDLIKRLMVQEPGRILMETMQVISELIDTNSVAVYQGQGNSPWFRLIGALNSESTMGGKTWNISENSKIYEAVQKGELFRGSFGTEEPAVVLPVDCGDDLRAIILVKSLSFENESLYSINMLKTLALLLRDSMQKALQNEELTRDERYVKGTSVMLPEAFREQVVLAQEKAEKHLADYCILELESQDSLEKMAQSINHTLRATDHLGTITDNRLFILLNNTDVDSTAPIQTRLAEYGIDSHPVTVQYEAD